MEKGIADTEQKMDQFENKHLKNKKGKEKTKLLSKTEKEEKMAT